MRKKLAKKKEYPVLFQNFIGIIISSFIGLLITLFVSFLLSILLNKSAVLPDKMYLYLGSAVSLGAIVSGFISTFKCKFKGIVSGVVIAIPFSLYITVVLLFFSNGHIESKIGILYLLIFILSAFGGILGANTKRRK